MLPWQQVYSISRGTKVILQRNLIFVITKVFAYDDFKHITKDS